MHNYKYPQNAEFRKDQGFYLRESAKKDELLKLVADRRREQHEITNKHPVVDDDDEKAKQQAQKLREEHKAASEELRKDIIGMEKKILEIVNKLEQNVEKNMEVVYVSFDLAQEQQDEHMLELGNWMSIPFGDQRNQLLKDKFKISAIP